MGRITDKLEQMIGDAVAKWTPEQLEANATKLDADFLNSTSTGPKGISPAAEAELRANPGKFVYQSDIIKKKAYFYQKPYHREIVYEMNAIMAAALKRIPDAICAIDPIFAKPGQEKEENPEEHKRSKKVWEDYCGRDALRKFIRKSIKHGGAIYEPLNVKDLGLDWYTNAPHFIRSWDEITVVEEYTYGFPTRFQIHPTNTNISPYSLDIKTRGISQLEPDEGARPKTLHTGFYFDPDNTDDHIGQPWFLGAWDNTIDYEIIKEARNSYDQMLGNGFIVIGIPANQYAKTKDSVKAHIANIRNENGIVIPINAEQPMEIKWSGAAGQRVDFNADLADIRRDIIAVMGYPERWLFGDDAGALAGGQTDRQQVHDSVKHDFARVKKFIYLFLKYHGAINEFSDVEVLPPYKFQYTELENAELEEMKVATTMQKAGILTTDELREELGYEAMTEEQKATMKEERNMDNGNNNENSDDSTDNSDNSDNSEDKTDSLPYLQLEQAISNTSNRELADFLGVASSTAGRIKSKFIENKTLLTTVKLDSIKLDSVQLDANTWQIKGLVIPAQEKYYPEYGRTYIRSPKQLKVAFESHKDQDIPFGVYPSDWHDDGVDVREPNTIGSVHLDSAEEDGIYGTITYDLNESKRILGDQDWIKDFTERGLKIPTSVGLKSTDIPIDSLSSYELNHKIRSFVATQHPRNEKAGGE